MSHFYSIHKDDAPYIKETVIHKTTWSEKIIPLVIDDDPPLEKPSNPSKPVLEALPSGLRYAIFRKSETCLVVIASSLTNQQEGKLLDVTRKQREAFGWTIFDMEEIRGALWRIFTHLGL